jgi:WXG100 family type VII secretion target
MSEIIKMNYPAMQEMAQHCKATAQRLMETVRLANQLAQQMQNGALVGDAGEAFAGALNSAFAPGVSKLSQKFEELAKDVEGAMADMRSSDSGAGGLFD